MMEKEKKKKRTNSGTIRNMKKKFNSWVFKKKKKSYRCLKINIFKKRKKEIFAALYLYA